MTDLGAPVFGGLDLKVSSRFRILWSFPSACAGCALSLLMQAAAHDAVSPGHHVGTVAHYRLLWLLPTSGIPSLSSGFSLGYRGSGRIEFRFEHIIDPGSLLRIIVDILPVFSADEISIRVHHRHTRCGRHRSHSLGFRPGWSRGSFQVFMRRIYAGR